MPATRFTLRPRGPYSLAASARFLEGFAPAAHEAAPEGHLHLAFPGPQGEPAGVCLCQEEDSGLVLGDVFGNADPDFVGAEAQRILSLDHEGTGFAGVGERDPVVGRLQARFAGLRPVLFLSPYEAAAWALIGHRIRIVQAAGVKARMAAELGDAVDIHGDVRHAFPPPGRLAGLEAFRGLFGRKAEWLRALGEAAATGVLDAAHLRSLPPQRALAELQDLPGIGPFSAELILLRGAGEADHLPAAEPRLRRAVALAYGDEDEPTQAEVAKRAERWRPYRTWVAVLLRAALEEDTEEIAGQGP
jgi:DNA-3-methyladenine glycosylase II